MCEELAIAWGAAIVQRCILPSVFLSTDMQAWWLLLTACVARQGNPLGSRTRWARCVGQNKYTEMDYMHSHVSMRLNDKSKERRGAHGSASLGQSRQNCAESMSQGWSCSAWIPKLSSAQYTTSWPPHTPVSSKRSDPFASSPACWFLCTRHTLRLKTCA